MAMQRFHARRLISLALVAAAVVAGVFFLRLPPTNAETQPQTGAVPPGGIISPATATKPAFIDPSAYTFPVVLSKTAWKRRLTANQYYILRQKGTEPPFSGKLLNNHRAGIYYSAATGQPLFSSKDKFNSGTGWPSFTRPISSKAVLLDADNSLGMRRVEVVDSLSGSHLGHVFNDGPPPTGKRYCIDSGALIFVPAGGKPPAVLKANNPAYAPGKVSLQ